MADIILNQGRFWRRLTNFWTFVMLSFIVWNFINHNAYNFLVVPLSMLYTGVLGLYVTTKEFERWYEHHESRHPGELFVILWTVVMVAILAAAFILGEDYHIPSDVIVGVYLGVLTLFAITQKSKELHKKKDRA
ncbi:MAG: phosphatase PAP2 family protein [Candidatus Colwellbacteria bacterium]|nr:phosphatase PAP2 family protein [Candidatus Colwellbacteria bacterium]